MFISPSEFINEKEPAVSNKIRQQLSAAKSQLVLQHPFFGSLALKFNYRFTKLVPTAAVMPSKMLMMFNPDFLAKLSVSNTVFLVAHECMHPMFEHHVRIGDRDPWLWNTAGDYVINWFLKQEKVGLMPSGDAHGLYDEEIYEKGEGSTDLIYKMLMEEDKKKKKNKKGEENASGGGNEKGQGKGGQSSIEEAMAKLGTKEGPMDIVIPCEDDEATKQEQIRHWQEAAAQAAQTAKMMGCKSANIDRFLGDLLRPRVDWREVLNNFLQRSRQDTRSFARFNRRLLAHGIYLPSVSGYALPEMVFAIDCSGSVGAEELNQFGSEIKHMRSEMSVEHLHIIYFDSQVCKHDTFSPTDEADLEPAGGGGTAFSPVISYINDKGITPAACVFLTDLYCNDFGPQPDYPVLFVSTEPDMENQAPWGEVVTMEQN